MKYKFFLLVVVTSALFGFMTTQAKDSHTASSTTSSSITSTVPSTADGGTISAVDIQAKTIQIGQHVYGLVDGIVVQSLHNKFLDQRALQAGQQVQYTLGPQPLDMQKNSPLPSQVVTHIRILSGINEDSKKD